MSKIIKVFGNTYDVFVDDATHTLKTGFEPELWVRVKIINGGIVATKGNKSVANTLTIGMFK